MMAQKSTENWRELEVWKVVVFDAVYGINIAKERLSIRSVSVTSTPLQRR